jgi:type VI protein secretion system component Hcp
MAPVYFLKLDGIQGESRDPEHLDELELDSFSWGERAPPPGTPLDASFTAGVSRASPLLFLACAGGQQIAYAVLTIPDQAGETAGTRWRFSDLRITEYETQGEEINLTDHVVFHAALAEEVVPAQQPALTLEVVRPDDLLNLGIEAVNLRLDNDQPGDPALVVDEAGLTAQLIVTFPPQSIAETSYFESSVVNPPDPQNPAAEISPDDGPERGPTADKTEPLDPPGVPGLRSAVAGSARRSRLVFTVPSGARLPFSVAGLLDWSGLDLRVAPIAAIPPDPAAEQIAAAPPISPPAGDVTALELPYRLVISPGFGVGWDHRNLPFTSRGRTELWHTRLVHRKDGEPMALSADAPAPLRAIWSDDFDPVDPPKPSEKDPELGLTAMSPNDRHQLVILTSAFHGYEVNPDLRLTRGPTETARLSATTVRIGLLFATPPYVPSPFYAEQLVLSPLGGWLRSRGHWEPPRPAAAGPTGNRPDLRRLLEDMVRLPGLRPERRPPKLEAGRPLRPPRASHEREPLDISEWVHVAALGRDHYVRIVYEGRLIPFGHRAALVKVTERKFKTQNGIVGAYLTQRMFIVVREPERAFARDRAMPLKRIRLTTLVTPDIAAPEYLVGSQRSFWVKVWTGGPKPEPFRFHAVGWDAGPDDGNAIDFTIPMVFASTSDVPGDPATKAGVINAYNDSSTKAAIEEREARVPGQRVFFAEQDRNQPTANTQLITDSLNFVVDAAHETPRLLKASVRIPQVQELLGTNQQTSIRLYGPYVATGFDARAGVWAEIVEVKPSISPTVDPSATLSPATLGVTFSSKQAGGFTTPNMGVATLTRALGPLAGTPAQAVNDDFQPASFFGGGLGAKLFGAFDLADLLPTDGTFGENAPKLTTKRDATQLTTALDWEPPSVNPKTLGPAEFNPDANGAHTALKVHGTITRPIGGADPTFRFTGRLNDFDVTVLKAVTVNFVDFAFTVQSGAKPDVTVHLASDPIKFSGDLEFVEGLRKAIPPGLFGDGPSLDLSEDGIRAGFAVALPPIAVGVFALKDVTLGAGLTLPFVDGKPALDFRVSQREHPFLLAVAIFGGGGFFHLQVDTAGIKELEAGLEFGAVASLDIGVASGGVQMMAGIYFSIQRRDPDNKLAPTLSGFLVVGGQLRVLGLITVSVVFNLTFTYDGGKHAAYGRATLVVQVDVALIHQSVKLTVEKSFGGRDGDPTFRELMTGPAQWRAYAEAFA